MPRPTDWNAIGLSGDPTPGEPDRITELADLFTELGGTARRIWIAVEAVMSNANDSVFVGEAADALRDKVDGRLRGHVEDVAWAFETSAGALREWAGTVTEQQQAADSALAAGRGLAEDDPVREQLATTAREAGDAQAEQGRNVAGRISAVSHISLPISACKVFWEAFQWLAIILIIPALIFGGPIALLALGVNLTLFIKTVVDFARGDATFLDLFLAGLGLIAPTTKGLPIFQIIKAGTKAFTQGLANFGKATLVLLRNLFTGGGFRFATIFPGLRDLVRLSTSWVRTGGLWVMRGITDLPRIANVVQRGGLIVFQNVKGLPALVRGLPAALGRGGAFAWQGARAGLGATWSFARAELGGGKWLRLLLPVDAREIGQFGLAKALRIGFFERGVLGQARYGAAVGAVGRGISAAPIPTSPAHGLVDGLVDLPRFDLANVRLGEWAGPGAGLRPFEMTNGALHTGLRPPELSLGPVGSLGAGVGERTGLGFHASRQLDALVDLPAGQLGAIRAGDWAVGPGRVDVGPGVSAIGAPQVVHQSGLYLPASAGVPGTTGLGALATGTPVPGAAHAGLAGMQAPAPGAATVDLLTSSARPGTTPAPVHTALASGGVTPPGAAVTPHTLTSVVPGTTPGLGHTALGAVQAPPPGAVVAGDLLTPGPAPHTGAPGGAHPAVGTGPHFRPAASGSVSALDLVAGGRAGPDLTVTGVSGAGSGLAERTTSALTANQVRLHLDDFVQLPPTDASRTLTDSPTTGPAAAPMTPGTASATTGALPPGSGPGAVPHGPALDAASPATTGRAGTSQATAGPGVWSATADVATPGAGPGAVPHSPALDTASPATAGRAGTSQATTGPGTSPVTAGALPPGSGPGNVPYSPVLDTGGPATAGRAGQGTGTSGTVATGPGLGSATAATTGTVPPGSAPGAVPHRAAVDTAGPVTTGAVPPGSGAGAVPVRPALDAGGPVTAGPVTTNTVAANPGAGPVTAGAVPPGSGAGAVPVRPGLDAGGPVAAGPVTTSTVAAGPGAGPVAAGAVPPGVGSGAGSHGSGLHPGGPGPDVRPPVGGGDHGSAGAPGPHGSQGPRPAADMPVDGGPGLGDPAGTAGLSGVGKGKGKAHAGAPAAGPGAGVEPGAPVGSRLPHEPGTAVPLTGASQRLTPDQIARLWARDADRVDALFGAADDPLREVRRDAWRDFAQARHDLGRNQALLREGPASTSSGPSVHDLALRERLDTAGRHYTEARQRLTDLGVDPGAIDRGMHAIHTRSLADRPRLDGGMLHLDQTPQPHPQPQPQPQPQPNALTNLLAGPGPHHPPTPPVPLRGFDGQPTGQVLHVDPAGGGPRLEGPGGAPVDLRDGRVRVAGPDGGFRDFDATGGQLLQERLPLYGPDGRPFHRAAVDVGPGGTYALHQGGGRQLDVLDGGGFRVSDPATGATTAFDARGAHLADGTRLRGPGGHFAPGDEIVTAGAGGRTVTDLDGTALPGRQVHALDGGGLRVTDPATGASARFTPQGIEVERGIALARADGTPVHAVANADGGYRLTDLDGGRLPGRIAADPDTGGFRVADGQGPGHQLYGPDGAHTGRGMPLTGRDGLGAGHLDLRTDGTLRWIDDPFAPTAGRAADRGPGGRIEVALPGGGHQVFDPASGALLREVTPLPGGAGTRTEWAGHHSVRQGEFMEVRADGSPLRQGVNVVQDGRRTDFQYVVDFPAGGGRATWHRTRVGADGGAERAVSGTFHQGTVKSYGPDGGWLRLDSSAGKGVEVFQRRVLPGGDVLDAFRRTDTVGFGHFNRRTIWVRWGEDGALRDWGTRHYDTAGTGWRDLPHTSLGDRRTGLTAVREYRDGLQAYDNGAGHVLAVRDDAGAWTWHRYDGGGGHLAEGPRTHDLGGGWTDRDATGAVVQRQWGSGHLPQDARHFQENRLAAQDGVWNRTDLWERQSPHGKESGKYERMGPGTYLRTERLGEQRPPAWFRDHFMADVGHAPRTHAHLGGDSRFQMFLWSKEAPGVDVVGGARYVGMDGGSVDLSAGGDFVRSTNKLHHGNTLKVGDHAPRPAHDPTPGALAWHEGGAAPRGGYRFESPAGGRTLWEDRISVDGVPQGQWPVAREGLPGGTVREYADPPAAHQPREAGSWVTRDAHGNLAGIQHPSRAPRVAGQGDLFVRGTGDPDASAWTWKLVDAAGDDVAGAGGPVAGRREFFRGSTDPALAWDDSFRDFDAAGNLVRERRMLDGGGYVDAWADGDRWLSAKYRRDGQAVDFGGGTQVRQWWHGGAWQDDWARGARHWQDVLRPQGGADSTLRSVPVHTNGPLRVREYRADGRVAAADGVWKEFDHGSVVRERKALGDGTFLETDAWRGQWRRYDAHGGLLAQRTDSGLVFESRGGQLHLTGNEYDFRGPLTELRGWGRRVREAQRMPWSGTPLQIGESLYQPYWQTVAGKAALEFGQEFVLEFGANLAVNGIVAAVQNKPFTGKDALKAFANAAVSAGIKTGVGTMIHENSLPLFRDLGSGRAGLANVDGGKHWGRAPMNHDKTWANEWGGNETATRWRGGTYDFGFGVGTSVLAGWVNGSMNAAVWGITDAEGNTVKLTGWDAVGDGGINALASLTTSVSTGLAKNIALLTTGGRLFHRQGFADFWLQLPFKIFEKSISSLYLTSPYRASINPAWYQVPPPASQNP